jgi:hypothetical protein
MKRNIILYYQDLPSNTDAFATYIDIRKIDEVINCSVDNLYCDSLEYLAESDVGPTLNKIQNKIRSDGTITIKILDIKKICLDFLQNHIAASKYLEYLANKKSIANLDLISSNINHELFVTTKLEASNYFISVIFTRKIAE